MFKGVNTVPSRVHSTSHFFSCKMDNLFPFPDLAEHLDPMAYRHGQKYHHQRDFKGHMQKGGSWV
jgi:hypothetical protein